jgi:hypothetical protein
VEAWWRRRSVRHVLVGLVPLLVAGAVVATVVGTRLGETVAPVRDATARAPATVLRSGFGAAERDVELRWTDDRGTERVSTVRAARAGEVPAGRAVELRYSPADPGGPVFVNGDETSAALRDLAFGLAVTVLLVAAVLIATAVHLARRLAAERRPGTPLPVRYAVSRRGVLRRSWLVVTDPPEAGRDRWVPVHWDPVLPRLPAGTVATVHGRPSRDRVVVADVAGVTVWQAGRRRAAPPSGAVPAATDPAGAGPPGAGPPGATVGLVRHLRADGAVLAAAPVAGLLWAYLDNGGPATWAAATALAAGLLVWLPTVTGTDPT